MFGQRPGRDLKQNITDRDVVKPELKREIATEMLKTNPPTAVFVSDYFCYIISVGRLYADCSDDVGNIVTKINLRTSGNVRSPPRAMSNRFVYDRHVSVAEFRLFINLDAGRDVRYHAGEDLKALNIISWKRIFSNVFQGSRLNDRFYPLDLPPRILGDPNRPLWKLYSGFFSSLRPRIENCFSTWIAQRLHFSLMAEFTIGYGPNSIVQFHQLQSYFDI